jgi:hypothetical protein
VRVAVSAFQEDRFCIARFFNGYGRFQADPLERPGTQRKDRRTYVHRLPLLVFPLPGASTEPVCHQHECRVQPAGAFFCWPRSTVHLIDIRARCRQNSPRAARNKDSKTECRSCECQLPSSIHLTVHFVSLTCFRGSLCLLQSDRQLFRWRGCERRLGSAAGDGR